MLRQRPNLAPGGVLNEKYVAIKDSSKALNKLNEELALPQTKKVFPFPVSCSAQLGRIFLNKDESVKDQGDVGVIWPTRSHLNNLQKELADARAKKIAYMALIMALDNIKLGIPW